MSTAKIVCRSVSNSINTKTFKFNVNSDVNSPITRVVDSQDFTKGLFIIVQRDNALNLAQINDTDLKRNKLTVSIFLPPLPSKKFSDSKSPCLIISTTTVIGRLVDPPKRRITRNNIVLSNEQFLAIQDLCDEF